MTTLDQKLNHLAPHLPRSLVSEDCLSHICKLLRDIPDAITSCFGFECSLAAFESVADFGFHVSLPHGGDILAGLSSEYPLPDRLLRQQAWQQVVRFSQSWCELSSQLRLDVGHIWLMFDIRGTTVHEEIIPNVYLSPSLDTTVPGQRTYFRGLEDSIALLRGSDLPPPVRRSLDVCLTVLTDLEAASVGVSLSRKTDVLRLSIKGLAVERIALFLRAIRWNGPHDEACRALLPFGRCPHHMTLDVGEEIGPRLGVECYAGEPNHLTSWRDFLDDLVERTLCVPTKRDALLNWLHLSLSRKDPSPLPEQVVAVLWLHGLRAAAVLVPSVSHIKVSYEHGRPLEAKAYFGVVDRWRVQCESFS
jgi:hypothetical protein